MRPCRALLESLGYRTWKRQLGEGGDDIGVHELPQLSIECKDWEAFAPWTWIGQCEQNTPPGGIGMVWFKQRNHANVLEGGLLIHARHLPRILRLLRQEDSKQERFGFLETGVSPEPPHVVSLSPETINGQEFK